MTNRHGSLSVRRFATDATAGLALFALMLCTVMTPGSSSPAGAAGLPGLQSAAAGTGPGPIMNFALLAGIFSLLVAFNLAFFRHIRQVYSCPRKADTDRRS